jgi:hypothetical protein
MAGLPMSIPRAMLASPLYTLNAVTPHSTRSTTSSRSRSRSVAASGVSGVSGGVRKPGAKCQHRGCDVRPLSCRFCHRHR